MSRAKPNKKSQTHNEDDEKAREEAEREGGNRRIGISRRSEVLRNDVGKERQMMAVDDERGETMKVETEVRSRLKPMR